MQERNFMYCIMQTKMPHKYKAEILKKYKHFEPSDIKEDKTRSTQLDPMFQK